jgi:hypothetical protein
VVVDTSAQALNIQRGLRQIQYSESHSRLYAHQASCKYSTVIFPSIPLSIPTMASDSSLVMDGLTTSDFASVVILRVIFDFTSITLQIMTLCHLEFLRLGSNFDRLPIFSLL